jgi:hypothetical protein
MRNRSAFGYMEPKHNIPNFAQCGSCKMWIKNRKECYYFTKGKEVDEDDSCIMYVQGENMPGNMVYPINAFPPEVVGFYDGPVRCENCISFNKAKSGCELFYELTEEHPDMFDLDSKVKPRACCNAFDARTKG